MTPLSFEDFIAADELPALVGKNLDRYRAKWTAMYAKAGSIKKMSSRGSWNWAAFLFTGAWLFYRKMYVEGACWAVVITALLVGEAVTGKSLNNAAVGLNFVFAFYGNSIYFNRTYQKLSAQRTADGQTPIASAGGTSWTSALLATAGLAVVIVASAAYQMGMFDGSDTTATADAPGSSSVASPAKTVAAPPPPPIAQPTTYDPAGSYQYREKGASGQLTLVRTPSGQYAVHIETADDKSGNTCTVETDEDTPLSPQNSPSKQSITFKWRTKSAPDCPLEVDAVPGSADVSEGEGNCTYYCGAGVDFSGVYVSQPK